jgi:MFS family permease
MGQADSLGPGFRALYRGSLVSNIGDGIRLAALPLLAASLTTSPLLIASVTAAQYLAWLTFGPFGGAVVDRSDRRRIILTTQLWRGLLMAGLGLLVWSDAAQIWHLCVVAFAIQVGEILVDPSTVALVPTLVDDADLDRANGRISSVEITTNEFAGPPIGSVVFAFAPWLPFLINASSYLGSLTPFRGLPRRPSSSQGADGRSPRHRLRTEAADGFRWLRRHHVLAPFTAAQVIYYFGFAAGYSLLVVVVTDALGGSGAAFGLLLAIGAAGGFLGTLFGARVAAVIGTRATLSGCVALQGATLAAVAIAPSVHIVAGLWFLNGIPAGLQRPVARTMQQRLTPNHLLGRVNVTTRIFTRGIIVFGALAAGALATATDVRWSFAAGGVIQLAAAAVMWSVLARLRVSQPSSGAPEHG